MKKFFAWVMVLAMVMTMMPVMDVHQHAHAATKCTGTLSCKCTEYIEKTNSWGLVRCANCGHKETDHEEIPDEEVCLHPNAPEIVDCTKGYSCPDCAKELHIKRDEHTPATDVVEDCNVAIGCKYCKQIAVPAGKHTPAADDGDCTTAIPCAVCGKEA